MASISKIAIITGAALLYLFRNKTVTLSEELDKLRKQMESGDSYIIDYLEERTQTPEQTITNSISVQPYLDFGEFEGAKWSVQMRWKLTNHSQYTYIVTGIKSVVTIDGYTSKLWMPAQTNQFVTLRPGQTAWLSSRANTIELYDVGDVRSAIRDHYYTQYDYIDGLDTVTNLRVQSLYGEGTVVSYEECRGQIRNAKGVTYFSDDKGTNMVGQDL